MEVGSTNMSERDKRNQMEVGSTNMLERGKRNQMEVGSTNMSERDKRNQMEVGSTNMSERGKRNQMEVGSTNMSDRTKGIRWKWAQRTCRRKCTEERRKNMLTPEHDPPQPEQAGLSHRSAGRDSQT